jgi:hypothetical protein
MPKKKKPNIGKIVATGKKIKTERLEKRKAGIEAAQAATVEELKTTPRKPAAKKAAPSAPKKPAKKAPAPGSRVNEFDQLKSTLKADAPEKVQEPGRPGAAEFSSEGARQANMRAAAERAANPEVRYDLSEIPSGSKPEDIKAVSAAKEDPKLTPKPTMEALPTEAELALQRRRNAPLARPQKSGILTGGTPERYTPTTTDPSNDKTRLSRGMGIAGEEKGIISHAINLLNRDNEVLWRSGKLFEKPKIATSYEDVRDTHQHRLAKVMDTFKVSEDALKAHAAAEKGGSRRAYEDTIEELHSATQEHNDFYGKKVQLMPGPNDSWQDPSTGQTHPVAANHPNMPAAFMRTKQPITRTTMTPEGRKFKRGHEGWDSVTVAGGTKVWRQQTAPEGMDLVDHLRTQILANHAAGAAGRSRKVREATTVIDSLKGGNKVIGLRQRGRAEPGTGIPAVSTQPTASTEPRKRNAVTVKYDPGQNSVTEALIAPKDAPTGLPTGDKTKPKPVKARSGRVLVRKGTTGLPISSMNLKTREPEVSVDGGVVPAKNLLRPLVDKNAMLPDKVPGAEVVPTAKPVKTTKEEKALAAAKMKEKGEKARGVGPLQKNTVNVAGKPSLLANPQMALPGFENVENLRVGGRAQRLLAEAHGTTPRETTAMEDVRTIKNAGLIVKPTPSTSREVAVREGSPSQKNRARKAAIQTRQTSGPMEQPMLPGKELRSAAFAQGGTTEKISEKTRVLQGEARKPSRSSNPIYVAANKILEENKDK